MGRLSETDVIKVAKLANLSLSSKEVEKYKAQLSDIVDYFEQLNEVNIDNVEPTSQTTGLENVFRSDEVDPTRVLSNEQALSGTENTHNGYVVVPMLLKQKDE
ncbi:MAG: Aspartyl/glutamyl-tRNA(Asn/Gln) amidotransferase subunit C [Candidatus Woesebacteria bacterium GW2011_GWB1_38_5b]|uniref:Aspartyl/glutamyl-tRNA(Asn/Gln) amidotransferase subunit C n=1 Tax=Candidatus Woesebacteria bacterium GW2011_GWB1_38_5b TaxID=1618569 RepID=A0A0G0K8D7_9BACT|nr:MAG: Aspartyl/glutamyl-tRNA(Asn/Gln) amidotransferase subunit C [Candidatus Woesebacteria bacterium GW2011_GWB1_38_5b]KKQ76847.1 MAG: Aspartyl/glutamyl-tRNA(Asn/Gln) amidotransferase subunit C [Parcubacteria group bacterium GW2011_GWA1_38_7]